RLKRGIGLEDDQRRGGKESFKTRDHRGLAEQARADQSFVANAGDILVVDVEDAELSDIAPRAVGIERGKLEPMLRAWRHHQVLGIHLNRFEMHLAVKITLGPLFDPVQQQMMRETSALDAKPTL